MPDASQTRLDATAPRFNPTSHKTDEPPASAADPFHKDDLQEILAGVSEHIPIFGRDLCRSLTGNQPICLDIHGPHPPLRRAGGNRHGELLRETGGTLIVFRSRSG